MAVDHALQAWTDLDVLRKKADLEPIEPPF